MGNDAMKDAIALRISEQLREAVERTGRPTDEECEDAERGYRIILDDEARGMELIELPESVAFAFPFRVRTMNRSGVILHEERFRTIAGARRYFNKGRG